jgi:hypothetical protein
VRPGNSRDLRSCR